MISGFEAIAMTDLHSRLSFGGGGERGGRVPSGKRAQSMRGGIGVANTIVDNMGFKSGINPKDPQGVWGRPINGEGDAYSGNAVYGGPAGR